MINRHRYKHITWIDLVSPTHTDIQTISKEFDIDLDVASDLMSPTLQPHTEKNTKHLYLVLHFPSLKTDTSILSKEQEVDFIIGKDFLITSRYEEIDSFKEFQHIFEINESLEEDNIGDSAFDIFLILTRRLYKNVEKEIHTLREKLEYIEKEIFEGYEKEMVEAISYAGRDILNLKQALDPHQDVLHSLAEHTENFAGPSYVRRVRSIEDLYYRSRRHITQIWQTLNELRETNNSLLSTKQNEIMTKLTIMAFVTFPLMLLSSIFGMNTHFTPIVGSPNDFFIIIAIMGISTLIMFFFFKKKHWL